MSFFVFFFSLNGNSGMVGSLPQRISFGHCFSLRKKNVVAEGQASLSLRDFCDSEFKRPVTGSGSQTWFPSCVRHDVSQAWPFKHGD